MPIENPVVPLGRTRPLCAEEETLQISASGSEILTSKSAMDMLSVQQPDKVSACPRCQSLDTKFCYYNNYNLKQPRHFCRKCQRYWTAGGSLRNVPVGAGRRKHKTPFNSTAPKSHSEGDDLASAHFDPNSGIASGMCYPSNKALDFLPRSHMGGTRPLSFQCVSPMSMLSHDRHSEAMVLKSVTDSNCLHDAQSEMQRKEEDLSSLRHHVGNLDRALHVVQKGPGHVQHSDETPIKALPGLHDKRVDDHVPPLSSSPLPSHRSIEEKMEVESPMSAYSTSDKKRDIAHPLLWLEQFAKEKASITSESMAVQGGYGYGNAVLPWSHPFMWPWLMLYATNNGSTCSNMDQAAVSAVWASAVTATAANILQSSPLWSPYGWGTAPVNVNKAEGLSSLGKRPCSSSHEQEPLRVPKTLKIGHPEEAMHSSILTTLGLSSLSTSSPASVTGFFNADYQAKADVLQHKPTGQLMHHHLEQQWAHTNPAAQARSLTFQESS